MERKRVKGYLVAAALLLLWAAADFYHHFFIGVDLTANYQDLSSVQLLVRNTLFQGIIKMALGLVVFAVGWFRGKEKPRPPVPDGCHGLDGPGGAGVLAGVHGLRHPGGGGEAGLAVRGRVV